MNLSTLAAIHLLFTQHGLTAELNDDTINIQDGLCIRAKVTDNPTTSNDQVLVQLDIEVESPGLAGGTLVDSFAGIGSNQKEAEGNAFLKFMTGSFHVIAETLTTHQCHESQVDWHNWHGNIGEWRVCSGPSLVVSSGKPPYHANTLYTGFLEKLRPLFESSIQPGPHWVQIFFGSMQGKLIGCDVRLDGHQWNEALQLFTELGSDFPDHYETLRHLLIAQPNLRQ